MMSKMNIKKYGFAFLIFFLLTFMLFIFGPAEIFFGNVSEFEFAYGDFAGYLAIGALGISIAASLFLMLVPEWMYILILSGIFGIILSGYLQIMIFNGRLDLLGLNPNGLQVDLSHAIFNFLVWIVLIVTIAVIAWRKISLWKALVGYGSAFLLGIQLIAWVSLLITAPKNAFDHSADNWHLSGENQYVVSADKNVIVFILDTTSNHFVPEVLEEYPDALDYLHDFTYYSNAGCLYFGTYPSLAHMLTGQELDTSIPINEWFRQIWTTKECVDFFASLKDKNYVRNLYTVETYHIHGTNSIELLANNISNVTNSSQNIDIFYKKLFKTMIKMSCYRMSPEILKPYFYTSGVDYTGIVVYTENINHNNWEFYRDLKEKGLTVDTESNYYIVQHLQGEHEYTTTEDCSYGEETTMEETFKGCMVMIEEYLNQLKELGVYDDATIIITADHGVVESPQLIFFMKEAGEKHARMQETNAPITLDELVPTVAEAVGIDYQKYGKSVHDFHQDELRDRFVWIRQSDGNRPFVPHYSLDRDGYINVYYVYDYTGDLEDLMAAMEDEPDGYVDMVDAFN